MKTKILGLLAAGLLAGPIVANAVPLTVGSDQWDITSCIGTWAVCNTDGALQAMPWWTGNGIDTSVAEQFALAWGATYPAQDSPWFTYDREGSTLGLVFAWSWITGVGASDVSGADGSLVTAQQTFAVASRIVDAPEPGTLVLLALGLAGLGLSRRRNAN